MATCYIAGAGEWTDRGFAPEADDFVIAADGGYRTLRALGARVDLLVGDLDSLGYVPAEVPLLRYPPEKDDTDLALALRAGQARGYRCFRLYGVGGGRADHMLASLQTLARMSREGADAAMICPGLDVFAVTDGTLTLPPDVPGKRVSVFCHGDTARGVTLTGLKYPLQNATLRNDVPLGVSNERLAGAATIIVQTGTLLVFCDQ